jgi:hypothetical protein
MAEHVSCCTRSVTVFQCLSCRLPLAPGVAHGSSAECAAALAAEIERLKARLSLREKKDAPPGQRDTSITPVAPVIALSSSLLR